MKKTKLILPSLLLCLGSLTSYAQPFRFVVATDGSGTHSSLQAAINDCPDGERSIIFIKNGTYNEQVSIGSKAAASNQLISLVGESADGVIITNNKDRGSNNPTLSIYDVVTMQIYAKDFYAENITVENTAGNVGQAEALYNHADRETFKNCRLIGYQDTHRSNKGARCYFKDCWIEGATDFIYAGGVIFFEDCTINCVKGGGYITAPEDCTMNIRKALTETGKFLHIGFFFRDCKITADSDVAEGAYYLGRPWKENSGSFYINCKMDKHINAKGWKEWDGSENTATMGEYNSMDLNGNPIDINGRVSWSMQLPKADVDNILTPEYIYNYVNSTNAYDPMSICEGLSAPSAVSKDGFRLSWSAVADAAGYVIYKDGKYLTSTSEMTYTDESSVTGTYTISTVSQMGALSQPKGFDGTGISSTSKSSVKVAVTDSEITLSENSVFTLYSTIGKAVKSASAPTQHISIANLPKGVYVMSGKTVEGETFCTKIIINKNK